MEKQNKDININGLLRYLQGCVERKDRGALADLRHGFSETTAYRAWSHIAEYCDLARDRDRMICLTIAAGFAMHGGTADTCGNMGWTLRRIALTGATGSPGDALHSFDGRFRRLLTCSTAQEVCERLVGVIRASKRKNVPIDFRELHRDLKYWGERSKLRWAAAYWGASEKAEGGEGN